MKYKILYFIYRRFAAQFQDFLVQDYLKEIPDNVVAEAISTFASHKKKLQKLQNYLAYSLHNRMRQDPKNSERYQGMFVQLKMYHALIEGRPDPVKPHEETSAIKPKKPFDYDAAMKGAQTFLEGKKEESTEQPKD